MRTMCHPGYNHNGLVATHELGHMMYMMYVYIYIYIYICIAYLYIYYILNIYYIYISYISCYYCITYIFVLYVCKSIQSFSGTYLLVNIVLPKSKWKQVRKNHELTIQQPRRKKTRKYRQLKYGLEKNSSVKFSQPNQEEKSNNNN